MSWHWHCACISETPSVLCIREEFQRLQFCFLVPPQDSQVFGGFNTFLDLLISRKESIQCGIDAISPNMTWFSPESFPINYKVYGCPSLSLILLEAFFLFPFILTGKLNNEQFLKLKSLFYRLHIIARSVEWKVEVNSSQYQFFTDMQYWIIKQIIKEQSLGKVINQWLWPLFRL